MKLMILDGNSIVNRAFYGIRMLNAPDGTPTNAVFGFLTIFRRLYELEQPQAVAVTFDRKEPTFRHQKYDGYKAQRKPMPEELAVQMPVLKSVLDDMGILCMELAGWEADDLLGTVARKCEEENWQCSIVTGDKDSFQLITEQSHVIHVKSRMGKTETIDYSPAVFQEEYGFAPIRMVDLKALMGDASDNIPGVPGIGEKTALELLHRFGSLEQIYSDVDALDVKPGVKKKLAEGKDSAELSYDLATIRCDAPIEFRPQDAAWDHDFKPGLYDRFLHLGFTKFIEQWGLKPAEDAPAPAVFQGECVSHLLKSEKDVLDAADTLKQRKEPAFYWCEPVLDYVAVHTSGDNDAVGYVLRRDDYADDYLAAIGALFDPAIQKVGHNIKDLQRALLSLGVEPEGWVFDTALAAYLLDATAGSYELNRLCVMYCGFEPGRTDSDDAQMSLLDDPVQDEAQKVGQWLSYAAALECLRDAMIKKLEALGMVKLYQEIELPLCPVLAKMEYAGFLVDRDALHDFGDGLTADISRLQQSIWAHAGEEFNILSPKQLGHVLFDQLQLPAGKKTKTGWSTNADVLEKLRGKHPIIEEILDYRTLTKLKSTYADGLLKEISDDGRIHTSFQMTVTATGRLSSTEPNLQNIPIRRPQGAQIRRMFVASPGKVLVDADYSQIELRLLAHISGDETMIRAFQTGEDIHAVTASQVFNVPLEEVTSLMRSRAKAVNFGIVYGISAFSLAQDIGVFQNEAKAYMDNYFAKYHGVREYMDAIKAQAKSDGYVTTLFGRRRNLPEIKSSNFNMRSFGERVALNMPIQGTAADIIKLAMVRVDDRLKKDGLEGKLLLQVHDELIVECPEAEENTVRKILKEEMEHVVDYSVPLIVEAKAGKTWAEAH